MAPISYGTIPDDARPAIPIILAQLAALDALEAQLRVQMDNFMANHRSQLDLCVNERLSLQDQLRILTGVAILE